MANNFKILELCESYGGGVKRQVDYLNNYHDANFSLTTVVSSKRGANVPKNYLVNDYMSSFLKNPIFIFKLLKKLHKLIKEEEIDLIHAHSTLAGVVAVSYKVMYGSKIPMVFTPHAYYSEIYRGFIKNKIVVSIEKLMNQFFFSVVHVSKEEEAYALSNGIVKREKSLVINNGVPGEEYKEPGLKDPSNDIYFVNVARCSFQKNPSLFIDIAITVVSHINNAKFIWVGDGPLLSDCKEKVRKMNMENKIKFVGQADDPYPFLYKSDFFLSTSRYEGQPFSVLEALSVGLPLIVTDVIGHTELVNKNGVLLTSKDINNKGRLMKKINETINLRKEFSKESYRLFLKKYRVEQMVKNIEMVYSEEINHS